MRKIASKSRWPGRSVLVALTLAVGVLGLLLLGSGVKADGPQYNASATTDVPETDCLANSNIESTFSIGDDPWPAAYYQSQVSFTPNEWGIAEAADIPIGAIVGSMVVSATLGWFNNPCHGDYGGSLGFNFDPLINCSIDTSDTVSFDDQFIIDPNGLPRGCNKYPEMLNTMFPGMTPVTRHAGFENIGINVSLNFLTFEPGTSIPTTAAPGVPPFSSDLGYVAMSVLNNPTAPLVKNQITDNCPPLGTETTYYGLSLDNPNTGEDESGYPWRTNPQYAGTYTFNGYTHSIRDADNDGIDNALDTCPHIPCPDISQCNPIVKWSGDDDNDGLDNACDPNPDDRDSDIDGDGFPNRQDNCPLVPNEDQLDSDYDSIGDACDVPDWDGDTVPDPGAEAFSPSVPNGDSAIVWFEGDVDISGPSCVELGADSDGDGFEDAEEANLGSCWDDPCPDEFCSGTEAADSTPEDISVAGSCTDEEDNDLDGYIDDVDGGCGDDTDGDGVSDDGEDDLGSDFEDANSTPEDASVCDVCIDSVDNDLDEDIDAADEGCAEAEVTPTAVDTDGDTVTDDEETALGSDPEDADSTPEDASVAGTCTDGVDNDGDGLTDDEDEGCVEPTPSPTVEVEICAPVFPGTYSGLVRIDGQPAAAGYEVTTSIDGVDWGSAIVSGGRYAMDIPDHMPSAAPCFEAGTITFTLNGMTCTPTADWASGLHTVDLSCAPAAPEVTPKVTPEVTPEVTPVAPPPSGAGGLSGSGTGLPLWALALASWAGLTIVAGLGTLVAVKRR